MAQTSPISHLVAVWNPSYADDAMDAHLTVLLRCAAAARRAGRAVTPEEVYVWWGKLRSPNRKDPLPHASEVLALREQIDGDIETHLYLTDFRSLYVALLDDIDEFNVLEEHPDEAQHAPAYTRGKPADFWFRLTDIRRIVSDDTPAVVEELKLLRNLRYHDRPVSIYGGLVDVPLIVRRNGAEATWFADRTALTGDRLWAEYDAERRTETERMARTLRDDLFGPTIWATLETATRSFLASAEAEVRAHRDDPAFDFAAPLIEYAKAIETELNALLFITLRPTWKNRTSRHDRLFHVDGRGFDPLERVPHQTLGALRNLLEHSDNVRAVVTAGCRNDADWLLKVLVHLLGNVVDRRNDAAHASATAREIVLRHREEIVGIGHEGLIVRIARAKLRANA